ncbi:energy transducer TonB [Rhodocyclus tenuis]|uniref:Protein TonB n=1 Tax=Rhodocyclus tenuis TaxID=1066 RepID=A0A840G496_RHOTE|nr:energy transducer TonB [Rhodocyclus tenuis]MBB4246725.1 protein TonB [Rhodocyclus tenuis]
MLALSASLILHGIVFGASAWQRPPVQALAQAKIRLVVSPGADNRAAPQAAQQHAPSHRVVEAAPIPPSPSPPPAAPAAPTRLATSLASATHVPVPDAHSAAPAVSAVAVPAAAAAHSVGDSSPSAAAGGALARDGASADALREYRVALAIEAKRFKRYPPLARERGWEGIAEVSVSAGKLTEPRVSLERSSGYAVLDEQTLEMLRRAAHATPLPEALRGRDFRVVLPVRFSLDSD